MGFEVAALAKIAMATQAAGAATSAVGSYYSAKGQKSALNFKAGIADLNARVAEQNAQQSFEQGQQQIAAQTLKAGQLKGAQRAALAANGVDLGVGSAAEILDSTDMMKDVDLDTMRASVAKAAWGHRTQATGFQNEALLLRASANGISPTGAGINSLLGSAANMAASYYGMSKSGAMKSDALGDFGKKKGWW